MKKGENKEVTTLLLSRSRVYLVVEYSVYLNGCDQFQLNDKSLHTFYTF